MTFFGPDIRNGLPIGLGSMAGFGRRAFTPSVLFAAGEAGAWYDPSDFSTLFEDSAGTTPVTAVEQAVGLSLDKSRGLVLGPELVTNGDFSSGTGWTTGGGWAIGSGVATATSTSTTLVGSSYPVVAGRGYRVEFDVVTITGGTLFVRVGQGTAQTFTTTGRKTCVLYSTNTTGIEFYGGTVSCSIDNISVRELAGTHRIQPGASSRPILRARYNRITYSEDFSNAAWSKVLGVTITAGQTDPEGGTTATQLNFPATTNAERFDNVTTFSAVSAGPHRFEIWMKGSGQIRLGLYSTAGPSVETRFDLTSTWTKYSVTNVYDGTSTGSVSARIIWRTGDAAPTNFVVWHPDVRVSSDTYLPYQRIAAATDYDTVGFPVYLQWDGSDDSMYTGGNLDLSGTDKVTVFAGVTKLSDAANGVIFESSGSPGTDNGVVGLQAPGGTPASEQAVWRSRGNNSAFAIIASGYSAPVTSVLTGIGNISGDVSQIRVDGALNNTNTGDQGTGNYGSYVLYMGRRNNASLPFNGREYGLIVRGAATSDALIQQTERWMAAKQGRTL